MIKNGPNTLNEVFQLPQTELAIMQESPLVPQEYPSKVTSIRLFLNTESVRKEATYV